MTREQFSEIMAYLGAGIQKPISPSSLGVYFDLLGDMSYEIGKLAVRRVLLEHRWATFPSVAELQEAAKASEKGQITELSAVEAWEMAWRAIGNIDPDVDGSIQRSMVKLPKLVAATIQAMGVNNLCYGQEPVAVIRAQFVKAYETLAARDKRASLFTPAMLNDLGTIRMRIESTTPAQKIIAAIGAMPS
jgi:hypothetical protein